MKILYASLLTLGIYSSAMTQCSGVEIQVSSSTETLVQLYNAGFFFINPGNENICDWLVSDFDGNIIHEATTTGEFIEQATTIFTHSIPTSDSMYVSLVITNETAGVVCNISDTLIWENAINNWEVLSSNLGVLPVKLLNFNGEASKNKILLQWQTLTEINNKGFEIQKSTNGRTWEKLVFVEGHGNSIELQKYQSFDMNPENGLNYYRLKQIDFNEHYSHSQIVSIDYLEPNSHLTVFPNPSSGYINLEIENPQKQELNAVVLDIHGRLIWSLHSSRNTDTFNQRIFIEASGVYFVRIQIGEKIIQEKLIVKTN